MHVAAANPVYITAADVPSEVRDAKAKEFKDKVVAEGKPADMADKIVDGQLKKYFAEQTLYDQAFIKNPDQTVGDLVKEHIAKLGENIVVRQMSRVELGVSE
jgi:elongation factor Ts